MRAIAEGRHVERVAEDQGLVFAKILRSALGKLGVACNDVDTSAAVAAAIREVAAGGAVEPQ